MQGQSKLTYLATFKVRPAPDGFYVVDCRTDEAGGGRREAGVGKVVAWFARSEEAARDARARSMEAEGERREAGVRTRRGTMQGYRDLVAWKKAMEMVLAVYEVTRLWPAEERFGLTSQAQRAAVSVPANIAEGQGRAGKAEFGHHLSMAKGSLAELETHLLIAQDLGYLDEAGCSALLERAEEVGRLIGGLMRSMR